MFNLVTIISFKTITELYHNFYVSLSKVLTESIRIILFKQKRNQFHKMN
ncbi:hypothetical protein EF62_0845 [Enterococcus faecalis 62]|nr:hypothetical protein EF62_0845 [Enterococcus faecalis 62]